MRILTVTHFFEGHGGGIERVAGQLCRQFVELGSTAAWVASDADKAPDGGIDAAPIRCINPLERLTGLPMPIPGLRGARTLALQVRRSDVVVIHDALYATSVLAMLMAKAWGKRTILIQHIADIPFSSWFLRAAMRAANLLVTQPMLRAADERVFISDTVRNNLLGKPPRQASELLFNGVDTSIFHPSEEPASAPDAVANISARRSARRILFVGRYVPKKGLAILRALALLRPDLDFYLVGNGPIRPRKWGFTNIYDLGPHSQTELADLYRWANILLLPSVGEGYPLVIQEAMACGLPVICGEPTNCADPDAVRWIKGIRVDLSDVEGSARRFGEAIDKHVLSTADRSEMATYAAHRYNWTAMARSLLALAATERCPTVSSKGSESSGSSGHLS